jgi:hypothetical protein
MEDYRLIRSDNYVGPDVDLHDSCVDLDDFYDSIDVEEGRIYPRVDEVLVIHASRAGNMELDVSVYWQHYTVNFNAFFSSIS